MFTHSPLLHSRIQTAGLGGLKPNTVMIGWPYGWREKNRREFIGNYNIIFNA